MNTAALNAFNSVEDNEFVAIAGDWHGQTGWGKYMIRLAAEAGTKVMLHLGDFGFWPGNSGKKYLHRINKELVSNDMFIFVTLGNHEDYVQISQFQPVPDMPGCVFNPDFPRIIVFSRGFRWNWGGKQYISVGGANSIDRNSRRPGVSWWEGEQISLGDVYRSIEGGRADIMLSHDLPLGVDIFGHHRTEDKWSYEALEYSSKSREALRQVTDIVKPSLMFHGHYHIPRKIVSTLAGFEGDYKLTSYCMDKDYSGDNLGVFNVKTQEFEILDIPKPDWKVPAAEGLPWWLDDNKKPWWN